MSVQRLAGLAHSNGSLSGDCLVANWQRICRKGERDKQEWITGLRARGVKASHPDDGWVDRMNNEIHLMYPDFDDGIAIGDLLALGMPDKFRVVTVTGCRENMFDMLYWEFQ